LWNDDLGVGGSYILRRAAARLLRKSKFWFYARGAENSLRAFGEAFEP